MFGIVLELDPPGTIVALIAVDCVLVESIAELAQQETVIGPHIGGDLAVSLVEGLNLDILGDRQHFLRDDIDR